MNSSQFTCLLSLLQNTTSFRQIYQLHAQILIHGLLPLHNHLLSKLVDLHSVSYARRVFDQMGAANDYAWNSMIRAYAAHGPSIDSLLLYTRMLGQGRKPSKFTYPFLLKACSALSDVEHGEQVHAHVVKFGFELDVFVNNALVDMYGKCFYIEYARQVFDEMLGRDEVSWNSIIAGCVHCGDITSARRLFEDMCERRNVVCWTALINGYGREGMVAEMLSLFRRMLVSNDEVMPNSATMVCLLSACSAFSHFALCRWLSAFIGVNRIPLDIMLTTALIDMHSRCGSMAEARRIFDAFPNKTLAPWNAMITGYAHGGLPEEAIQLFYFMQDNQCRPNEITMVSILSACASLGALELGREIHLGLNQSGLQLNVIVATALIDMYSKCGCISDACLVFVKTKEKDVILWNAMIGGLAAHGHGRDSLNVFSDMERSGTRPNDVTFIEVLSACAHSGLVEDGRTNFEIMTKKYNLTPKIEHYSCMVDLLGRAGCLEEAISVVRSMITRPDSIIWGSLLNACNIHRNIKLADEIGEILLSREIPNLGCYILLSNIYAASNRWADVARVRRFMKDVGMKKPSGCSWIEVSGVVHRFLVEDTLHPDSEDIYEMYRILVEQLKFEGYVPKFNILLMDFDEID